MSGRMKKALSINGFSRINLFFAFNPESYAGSLRLNRSYTIGNRSISFVCRGPFSISPDLFSEAVNLRKSQQFWQITIPHMPLNHFQCGNFDEDACLVLIGMRLLDLQPNTVLGTFE